MLKLSCIKVIDAELNLPSHCMSIPRTSRVHKLIFNFRHVCHLFTQTPLKTFASCFIILCVVMFRYCTTTSIICFYISFDCTLCVSTGTHFTSSSSSCTMNLKTVDCGITYKRFFLSNALLFVVVFLSFVSFIIN